MLLYRFLLLLLSPAIFLHLAWRALQCRQSRYFRQRLGRGYDAVPPDAVWVHCASVGEVRSVLPLLKVLRARHPGLQVVLSSNTATSRQIVQQQQLDWLHHLYCPIDWRFAVNAFLDHVQPGCAFIFETELWPNLVDATSRRDIPVTIVNGRLSERSMRRAWLLRTLYARPLSQIRAIHARNDVDRDRFIDLGAAAQRVFATGDVKMARSESAVPDTARPTERPYVLVVSTHEDEELQLVRHCRELVDRCLVVIAPRHPERGQRVAAQLHGEDLHIAMHSGDDAIGEDTDIYLLDAIGLLDNWYPYAECVVMGGSFADIGGHNLIEPLAFDRAVVYGPSMHNFVEMHQLVQQHAAAVQVEDYAALCEQLTSWLGDAQARRLQEQRAHGLSSVLSATMDGYIEVFESVLAGE